MAPEILDLGWMTIRGYGLMIGISIPIAFLLVGIEARRVRLPALDDHLVGIFVVVAATAFLGGKLGFALAYPEALGKLVQQYGPSGLAREGFVFYGALILCVPAAWLMLRHYRLPIMRSYDVLVLPVAFMHAMGRVGCFLAGCCYGCRSEGPMAVTFEKGIGLNGVPLHPTQLYEAVGELAIFAFLWLYLRYRTRFPGQLLLSYFIGYAVLRLGTELFRGDGNPILAFGHDHPHHPGDPPQGLTVGQITSLVILTVTVPLLIRGLRRARAQGGR